MVNEALGVQKTPMEGMDDILYVEGVGDKGLTVLVEGKRFLRILLGFQGMSVYCCQWKNVFSSFPALYIRK